MFDLELVEGVDTSVDCLTMSYLNYTDFIAFDNEKLTCSFGNFANSVETNKTFNLNNNTAIYIHSAPKSQKVEKYAKIIFVKAHAPRVRFFFVKITAVQRLHSISRTDGAQKTRPNHILEERKRNPYSSY